MRKIAVGDIMTQKFISIGPTATLQECAKLIVKNKINTLPITTSRKLVGILNARDLLWALTKKQDLDLSEANASDVAVKKVAVIKPSADISQALKKMRALNFRTLPVISKGNLIGIVTLKDILKIEPELYHQTGELIRIKEEERKLKEAELKWPQEGLCDNCNTFSDLLKVYDQLLCPECCEELY
jgi:CBS domain-containing protein